MKLSACGQSIKPLKKKITMQEFMWPFEKVKAAFKATVKVIKPWIRSKLRPRRVCQCLQGFSNNVDEELRHKTCLFVRAFKGLQVKF